MRHCGPLGQMRAVEITSSSPSDEYWSACVLGPPPAGYRFDPKHKSSGWATEGGGKGAYDTEAMNG